MTDPIEQWKAAGEDGDATAAVGALRADAELVSPITDQFVFHGPEEIALLLRSVFAVVDDFRYTDDIRSGAAAVLTATSTVAGTALHEMQHLELDADSGRIRRVTAWIRPLPALTRLGRLLGPELARRQGRSGAARALVLAGGLLDHLAGTGDRQFVPLAAPPSVRR